MIGTRGQTEADFHRVAASHVQMDPRKLLMVWSRTPNACPLCRASTDQRCNATPAIEDPGKRDDTVLQEARSVLPGQPSGRLKQKPV